MQTGFRLHADASHLVFNMFGLVMFGRELERALGRLRVFELYASSVVCGALVQILVMYVLHSTPYPTIGASAGVFGVLIAYAMLFPDRRIVLLFPPIPMPVWPFATGYGVIELVLGISGQEPGVAHFAHLGGMAAAIALVISWARRAHEPS